MRGRENYGGDAEIRTRHLSRELHISEASVDVQHDAEIDLQNEYRNFSARVKAVNTPESDAKEMVMHVVSYDVVAPAIGIRYRERKTMDVLARDPMDAIYYARNELKKERT